VHLLRVLACLLIPFLLSACHPGVGKPFAGFFAAGLEIPPTGVQAAFIERGIAGHVLAYANVGGSGARLGLWDSDKDSLGDFADIDFADIAAPLANTLGAPPGLFETGLPHGFLIPAAFPPFYALTPLEPPFGGGRADGIVIGVPLFADAMSGLSNVPAAGTAVGVLAVPEPPALPVLAAALLAGVVFVSRRRRAP